MFNYFIRYFRHFGDHIVMFGLVAKKQTLRSEELNYMGAKIEPFDRWLKHVFLPIAVIIFLEKSITFIIWFLFCKNVAYMVNCTSQNKNKSVVFYDLNAVSGTFVNPGCVAALCTAIAVLG